MFPFDDVIMIRNILIKEATPNNMPNKNTHLNK